MITLIKIYVPEIFLVMNRNVIISFFNRNHNLWFDISYLCTSKWVDLNDEYQRKDTKMLFLMLNNINFSPIYKKLMHRCLLSVISNAVGSVFS